MNHNDLKEVGPVERFFARIVVGPTDCWEWQGDLDSDGYGRFYPGRSKQIKAHRWSYDFFNGEITSRDQVHHKCRNRKCVSPKHLIKLRSTAHQKEHNRLITHCPRGHEYTEHNTIWKARQGYWCRSCRECAKADSRRRYWRRKREQ